MGDLAGGRVAVDRSAPIPGTSNTRAVSGFRTLDGRSIRDGLLFRAEVLGPEGSGAENLWADEHEPAYSALGLRLVVDLRSAPEFESVPSAWATHTSARLFNAPIPEGVEGSETDFMGQLLAGQITSFDEEQLGAWYADLLDRRACVIGDVVRELTEPDSLPALVHCRQGKDRTGLVIAVILEALGVAREDVIRDYALTDVYRSGQAEKNAALIEGLGLEIDAVRTFWESPARTMEIALRHLDSQYGGAVGYLVSGGNLTHDHVERLRSRLLTEA